MNRTNRSTWLALAVLAALIVCGMTVVRAPVHAANSHHKQAPMVEELKLFRSLLGLILDFDRIAQDDATSGVMAVLSVEEHTQDREAAIEFLERMLPETHNDVVRRAIRIQLADHYKEHQQRKKSLEQIEALIKGAGAGE